MLPPLIAGCYLVISIRSVGVYVMMLCVVICDVLYFILAIGCWLLVHVLLRIIHFTRDMGRVNCECDNEAPTGTVLRSNDSVFWETFSIFSTMKPDPTSNLSRRCTYTFDQVEMQNAQNLFETTKKNLHALPADDDPSRHNPQRSTI